MKRIKDNTRLEWALKNPDNSIMLPVFHSRKALITHYSSGDMSWKEVRRYGHRAVKVQVTEIKPKDGAPSSDENTQKVLKLYIHNSYLRNRVTHLEDQIKNLLVQLAEKGGRENEEGEQTTGDTPA